MAPHAMEIHSKSISLEPVLEKKQLKLLPSPTITTEDSDKELPQLITTPQNPRPVTTRSFTDPTSPASPSQLENMKITNLTIRPRNRSPYSRPHLRSRSTASSLTAPLITRSMSSPTIETLSQDSPLARPSSPLYSSTRRVSPLRRSLDESSSGFEGIEIHQTIAENSELDLTPRHSQEQDALSTPHTPSSPYSTTGTFPGRARRRPSSPLHLLPVSMTPTSRLHTSMSSPALRGSPSSPANPKYNEAFPISTPYASSIASNSTMMSAASSIPSTPTSFRSRSPSISSLETIPDSPDAEEQAVEQTEKELKERELEKEQERKLNLERGDVRTRGRSLGRDGGRERKRWSVCGAERRGDLDVIYED